MKQYFRLAGLVIALLIGNRASAAEPAPVGAYPDREFAMSLYLWGAGIKGTVGTDSVSTDVDADFSDIVENLNMGAMVAAGARWGRFVTLFDGLWMELEDEVNSGPAEINATLEQGMADLKVGYRLLEPTRANPISFDLLAGARYWYVGTDLDPNLASGLSEVDGSSDWIDPVVGARLNVEVTPAVHIVLLADMGGWDIGSASHQTWQMMGLLGFKLSDAWSLSAGYRSLQIDRDLADVNLSGPIAGVVYRF